MVRSLRTLSMLRAELTAARLADQHYRHLQRVWSAQNTHLVEYDLLLTTCILSAFWAYLLAIRFLGEEPSKFKLLSCVRVHSHLKHIKEHTDCLISSLQCPPRGLRGLHHRVRRLDGRW